MATSWTIRPKTAGWLLLFLFWCQTPWAATEDNADQSIALAVAHMTDAQLDSGLFRYEHNFLSGRDSKKNNVVRQAGAAYALAEYQLFKPDPVARAAVERAVQAYHARSVLWKDGKLFSLKKKTAGAKAGATALALLSALMIAGEDRAPQLQNAVREWLQGLLALQMQDGGFEARPGSGKQSAYSNGEIWLALAYYDLVNPGDRQVKAALDRADMAFIQMYGMKPDVGFFHWGVMAAATRYRATGDERFADFAAQQMRQFMDELKPKVKPWVNSCYSVEGLLAGAGIIADSGRYQKLYETTMKRVGQEMEKNLRLQIRPDQKYIQMGPGRYLAAPEIPDYAGAFLNGLHRPQVRIDATQHCLSALVKMRQSREGKDSTSQ